MMQLDKTQLFRLALSGVFMLSAGVASAQSAAVNENINVDAEFRKVLTLTEQLALDFTTTSALIDYASGVGATDFARLATTGAVTFAGTNFSGSPTGQAGDITVSGENNVGIEIRCTDTATMALSTDDTETLAVTQAQISMNTGDAWGSADFSCAGLGGAAHSHTLDNSDGTDTILIGARVAGKASLLSGSYSTGNTGGTPLTIRVQYP